MKTSPLAIACLASLVSLSSCASTSPPMAPVHTEASREKAAQQDTSGTTVTTAPAASEKLDPDKLVARFLSTPLAQESWFSPDFLRAVPLSKVQAIHDQITASLGAFQRVDGKGPSFEATFEKGREAVTAQFDAQGRFTLLLLKPIAPTPTSMNEVLDGFKKLPGKVSVVILEGDKTLGALEPDAPLAIGSTFKLAVLATLREQIDAKKRSWRDVVELSSSTKSLPSGLLQDWPDGAPLTLYTLAGLMISRSDNTATDTLVDVLGRRNVEPRAGKNHPLLTTRDLFFLKSPGNEPSLSRWRAGDETARRALLDEIKSHAFSSPKDYPSGPAALDVEWFFSTRELCTLMAKVADLPVMAINPGVADKKTWTRVAYKGGSEPGVLNTTTWLEKAGHSYCVSTTWNADQSLDEPAFFKADNSVFQFLATLS